MARVHLQIEAEFLGPFSVGTIDQMRSTQEYSRVATEAIQVAAVTAAQMRRHTPRGPMAAF